jgi:hypothetical protein
MAMASDATEKCKNKKAEKATPTAVTASASQKRLDAQHAEPLGLTRAANSTKKRWFGCCNLRLIFSRPGQWLLQNTPD